MVAHTTIVFCRYIMLALEDRESKDPKTLGNLFYLCCDELQDLKFEEAFQIVLAIFKDNLRKILTIPESILKGFMDNFMASLPASIKGVDYDFAPAKVEFVINFAAWILGKHGKRLPPKRLQKELGAMTIVEQRLEPIGIRRWVGANIPGSVEILVNLFQLPHPVQLIEIVNTPIDYPRIISDWVKSNLV